MAFRSKAAVGLIAAAFVAAAQPAGLRYLVRHEHLRKGASGTITFTNESVTFEESGKKGAKHSRTWKYADIQRLELAPDRLRIVGYEDNRWQLGRDREYVFDSLPQDMAAQLYPNLYARLDQRFIARVPDSFVEPVWQAPAKLIRGLGGVSGTLRVGDDRIVFESPKPGDSRTWRYSDVQNIASAGPFDFTIASLDGDTRFQLKQALPEEQFNRLWRRVNQANGLQTFGSKLEKTHQ